MDSKIAVISKFFTYKIYEIPMRGRQLCPDLEDPTCVGPDGYGLWLELLKRAPNRLTRLRFGPFKHI